MRIRLTPTSASREVIIRFQTVVTQFPSRADAAMKGIADDTVEYAKKVLEQQLFKGEPLKPGYVRRKQREGLDPRTLIATKAYLRSIKARKITTRNYGVLCDVKKMLVHEFGNRKLKIPPRPHWQLVILYMEKNGATQFAREVLKELYK